MEERNAAGPDQIVSYGVETPKVGSPRHEQHLRMITEDIVVVPGVANQEVIAVVESDCPLSIVHDEGARKHISPLAQQHWLPPALFVEKHGIESALPQPGVKT